jgi:pimeloyl-ACP methyl ester carboxylesterase
MNAPNLFPRPRVRQRHDAALHARRRWSDRPPDPRLPQDWYEWRAVIPHLTSRFSVVAVDLRGVGGSAAPATGYDAACMATDVAELVDGLGVCPCTWSGTTSAAGWRTR